MNNIEIVSVIKSERPDDLLEWVNYHLAIGFDKINIYNDNSSFSVSDLFSDNEKVVVENIREKSSPIPDLSIMPLYEKITRQKEGEENFVAFIDSDEFIYIKNKKTIKDILNDDIGVLCLFWKFLSSSTILHDRTGTVIETFTYTNSWNTQVHLKSIVNFAKCKGITWVTDCPHLPTVGEGIAMTTPLGTVVNRGHGNADQIPGFYDNQEVYIYHYFYQTVKDWLFKITNRPQFNIHQFLERPMYDVVDNSMLDKKKELGI